MLTLSDTENNLHFILVLQGLVKHKEKGEAGRRGQTAKSARKSPAADSKQLQSCVGIFRICFSLKLVSVRRAPCGAHPSPARVPPAHPEGNPSQHHLSRE